MKVLYDKNFRKRSAKLPIKLQDQIGKRIDIFISNQFDPTLNNHPLHGEYENYRSINITGDYRAIYFTKGGVAIFIRIGTHSELFG